MSAPFFHLVLFLSIPPPLSLPCSGGAIEITVTGQSSSDEGSGSGHSGDGSGSGHSSGGECPHCTVHVLVFCGRQTNYLLAGPEVGTYLLGCISLILNTVCTVGPPALQYPPPHKQPPPPPPPLMQAVYVLLQKRFIFMAPNCEGCSELHCSTESLALTGC